MRITVINGTEKRGVTYRLKEMFLDEFSGAEITEYYLPKGCPAFCAGCTACFLKGEENCKDSHSLPPQTRLKYHVGQTISFHLNCRKSILMAYKR